MDVPQYQILISIHALLAESDEPPRVIREPTADFYPRSPCGERPIAGRITSKGTKFLSTLSLRRATHAYMLVLWVLRFLSTLSLRRATVKIPANTMSHFDFYPRSPCGERLIPHMARLKARLFLSTLSLRRATQIDKILNLATGYFYPRSPCGERHPTAAPSGAPTTISIHALLAESDPHCPGKAVTTRDFYPRSPCGERQKRNPASRTNKPFLSTLSLRRATLYRPPPLTSRTISIHALLAESDFRGWTLNINGPIFLSTLSLRRATAVQHP